MKHHSTIDFLIIIILFFTYYLFFKNPQSREPVFYSFNNKILLLDVPYENLLLKKIKKIESISEIKSILELEDGTKYILYKKEYTFSKFLELFYIPIIISLVALYFSFWFYELLYDLFFSIFFFLKSILIFIFLLGIYYPNNPLYFFLWCIIATLFIISYVNLNIRFLGKSINTFILLLESIIFCFIILYLVVEDETKIKENIFIFFYNIFIIIFSIFIFINSLRIFDKNLDKIDRLKISSFILGNLIGLFPLILLFYVYHINMFVYLLFSSVYPFLIAYSLYRMYLVPSQIVITKTFITGIVTIAFISIYFIAIYIYASYFPYHVSKYRIYYDLFFLVFLRKKKNRIYILLCLVFFWLYTT
ncbi:MAG: hypothetical protein ACK42K_10895 [Leptonema sp. (in: bacteria)]